jgi:hypothetical protein
MTTTFNPELEKLRQRIAFIQGELKKLEIKITEMENNEKNLRAKNE